MERSFPRTPGTGRCFTSPRENWKNFKQHYSPATKIPPHKTNYYCRNNCGQHQATRLSGFPAPASDLHLKLLDQHVSKRHTGVHLAALRVMLRHIKLVQPRQSGCKVGPALTITQRENRLGLRCPESMTFQDPVCLESGVYPGQRRQIHVEQLPLTCAEQWVRRRHII